MATLWMISYDNTMEVPFGPPHQKLSLTISGVAAQSAALTTPGSEARMMRVYLFADTDCHVLWGDNPTADTTDHPLAAETWQYVGIPSGYKISVIERV